MAMFSGVESLGRLLRDTPGAVRARIRIHGIKGTIKALPEMTRFALRNYVRPAAQELTGASPAQMLLGSGEGPIDAYDAWLLVNRWTEARADDLRGRLEKCHGLLPRISVVMPVYNPPEKWLNRAIESVAQQVYPNWELCIADDCSTTAHVRRALERWRAHDTRIKVAYRQSNGHISRATNSAAELASGEFLAFLDHDDELTPDALGEVALRLAEDPAIDLLYSDDDKIDESGRRYAPQFKGEYAPELLLSYMYFCHLLVARRRLFTEVGGIRPGYEGSQDHDFALRAVEKARKVAHLPMVLYHWRAIHGSLAAGGDHKPASFTAAQEAVQDALNRRGITATAYQPKWAEASRLGVYACEFPDEGPSVTLIIPTRNRLDLIRRCVESLKATSYRNYEILVVDNESDDPATLDYLKSCGARVLRLASPGGQFSFAYLNNRAVEVCQSDYILLLNNDTEVTEPKWLSRMMGYAQMAGVGSVGARLLFPDDRVQHAGIVHGLHGLAGHAFKLMPAAHPGYLCLSLASRNVAACTAACLLMPRKVFTEIGGLDEKDFNVAYNDVDLGYRLLQAGYRNVYCASAVLRHHEGASRGFADNPRELVAFRRRYERFQDPFYSPHLSLRDEKFRIQPVRHPRGDRKLQRVLYFTHALSHTGAPIIQSEVALQLRDWHGIEPVIFSPDGGPLAERYRSAGVKPIIGPQVLHSIFTQKATYEEMLDRIGRIIRDSGAQVIYANTMLTFWAICAAAKVGVPSIWNIHESEGPEHYIKTMGHYLAGKAAQSLCLPYRVVFGSRSTMRVFERLETRHNFTYQHNAIAHERLEQWRSKWTRESARQKLGIVPGDTVLLLTGTVCRRKGQLDLVEAYARLSYMLQNTVRCFLVGDVANEYSQRVHDMVAAWPAYMRERFSVVPETGEIGKYYLAADVFVCTSRTECFPRVTLEAMHCGLPIVTTPVFGVPEQVFENVNGLYYQPGNSTQLAQQLTRLLMDSHLRNRLADNSVQVIRALPDDRHVAQSYARILEEAALTAM